MKIPKLKTNQKLLELLSKAIRPMTVQEKRDQRISWVYGQVSLSGSPLTKKQVAKIIDDIDGASV